MQGHWHFKVTDDLTFNISIFHCHCFLSLWFSFFLSPTPVIMEVSATPCGMASPVPTLHTRRGKPARKFSGVNSAHVPLVHSASWFLKGLNVGSIHSCCPSNLLGTFQLSEPETVKKKKREFRFRQLRETCVRSLQSQEWPISWPGWSLQFMLAQVSEQENGPLQQQTRLFDYFKFVKN